MLRPHQRQAIERVLTGWETSTGQDGHGLRTARRSRRMALRTVSRTPTGVVRRDLRGSVAVAAEQTLRTGLLVSGDGYVESFAVCSDTRIDEVKRGDEITDIATNDLVIPATTTAQDLADGLAAVSGFEGLTVVFATYQERPGCP